MPFEQKNRHDMALLLELCQFCFVTSKLTQNYISYEWLGCKSLYDQIAHTSNLSTLAHIKFFLWLTDYVT